MQRSLQEAINGVEWHDGDSAILVRGHIRKSSRSHVARRKLQSCKGRILLCTAVHEVSNSVAGGKIKMTVTLELVPYGHT